MTVSKRVRSEPAAAIASFRVWYVQLVAATPTAITMEQAVASDTKKALFRARSALDPGGAGDSQGFAGKAAKVPSRSAIYASNVTANDFASRAGSETISAAWKAIPKGSEMS